MAGAAGGAPPVRVEHGDGWLLAERGRLGGGGPFQFKWATFGPYGVDGNGDGVVGICGFVDSLMSAAVYLRAMGADDNLDGPGVREALDRYGTDVDRVIDLARFYRARDASLTAEVAPSN